MLVYPNQGTASVIGGYVYRGEVCRGCAGPTSASSSTKDGSAPSGWSATLPWISGIGNRRWATSPIIAGFGEVGHGELTTNLAGIMQQSTVHDQPL